MPPRAIWVSMTVFENTATATAAFDKDNSIVPFIPDTCLIHLHSAAGVRNALGHLKG